ncbi:MAG: ATP-dependent helicase [Ferruginibacter sp.]|nr:ATP-dependent helicase [Cytophagales bacterium]
MKVSTTQPFQLIYSLFEHEYLGYLFEAFVVQVNGKGQLTLQHQSLSDKNAREFATGLDEQDFQLVRLTDALQQEVILRKFSNKKIALTDFFLKAYDPHKGDKALQEAIEHYVDGLRADILGLVAGKQLFIMGNDGDPTWKRIQPVGEKASVRFHFRRNPDNTHYFPTVRCGKEKVDFQFRNALIICNQPAWMILDDKLYGFDKEVDGKKIKPFLGKHFIVIPRNVEDTYYRKFVAPLVAAFDVHAKGFEIRSAHYVPQPLLTFSEVKPARHPALVLFGDEEGEEEEADYGQAAPSEESQLVFELSFGYGDFRFKGDTLAQAANVSVERNDDQYIFHKIRRDLAAERRKWELLRQAGLETKHGRAVLPRSQALDWMREHGPRLQEQGFALRQNANDVKKYFVGPSSIQVSINENTDWFDIYATVRFGDFEIPFLKLRNLILAKKREFTLPSGEVAVIPGAWFAQYAELLAFVEETDADREPLTLRKHHLSLVQDLQRGNLAQLTMNRRLAQLRDFEEIEDGPLPAGFVGTLRPYQKAGYNWMLFLNKYHFGGCLADDMGLGKTVQTLALLQAQKEAGSTGASLLIMPTSLIYNWAVEARRFTPQLRVFTYTGTLREKNVAQFEDYDLVLTSYGIARIDVDLLKTYCFHYVILDESQAIKNPTSHIARAVTELVGRHRLILTGTPLENSTLDLWSQMSFINPGLLGTQTFFRNEFLFPIERKNDGAALREQKMQRLYAIIKPFILRRHKSQVATELPEKVESIQYCQMSERQQEAYEAAKSHYRNKILEHIDQKGMSRSQLVLLQGLTKLRQLANHPKMVNPDYEGDSGKLKDVIHRLETAIAEGHKILVFSQFVKHLAILRAYLDENKLRYAYLDGATRARHEPVGLFQTDARVSVFLISLRAGGLGLNLTAADYVFILDPWWNPAIEAQAIDRAHRIGQENKVFTYKFITQHTVEEKILALQRNKQRLASELITTEEGFVKSLSKEDVLSLLE